MQYTSTMVEQNIIETYNLQKVSRISPLRAISGVFCEDFGENGQRYKESILYHIFFRGTNGFVYVIQLLRKPLYIMFLKWWTTTQPFDHNHGVETKFPRINICCYVL